MEGFIRILSALLTPLIAIIATYIAYQQYRANKLKLRHDLFERRIHVYNTIAAFLVDVWDIKHPQLYEFLRSTREAHFLFGPKASSYVLTVYHKAVELYTSQKVLNSRQGDDENVREREARRQEALASWFSNQKPRLSEIFERELSLIEGQAITGVARLGIVSSIVWVTITSGAYLWGLFVSPRSARRFDHFYRWNFGSHPMIDWPSFTCLVALPVTVPWLVFLIVKTTKWVTAGFSAREK